MNAPNKIELLIYSFRNRQKTTLPDRDIDEERFAFDV